MFAWASTPFLAGMPFTVAILFLFKINNISFHQNHHHLSFSDSILTPQPNPTLPSTTTTHSPTSPRLAEDGRLSDAALTYSHRNLCTYNYLSLNGKQRTNPAQTSRPRRNACPERYGAGEAPQPDWAIASIVALISSLHALPISRVWRLREGFATRRFRRCVACLRLGMVRGFYCLACLVESFMG